MLAKFEAFKIGNQRLVRVRLFDSRWGVANLHGQRWPLTLFDEVMTEAIALRLSFDIWRDIVPCWQHRVQRANFDQWWRSKMVVYTIHRKLRSLEPLSDAELKTVAGWYGPVDADILNLYGQEPPFSWPALVACLLRRKEKLAKLERWFSTGTGG
jgi:hypothetical protein